MAAAASPQMRPLLVRSLTPRTSLSRSPTPRTTLPQTNVMMAQTQAPLTAQTLVRQTVVEMKAPMPSSSVNQAMSTLPLASAGGLPPSAQLPLNSSTFTVTSPSNFSNRQMDDNLEGQVWRSSHCRLICMVLVILLALHTDFSTVWITEVMKEEIKIPIVLRVVNWAWVMMSAVWVILSFAAFFRHRIQGAIAQRKGEVGNTVGRYLAYMDMTSASVKYLVMVALILPINMFLFYGYIEAPVIGDYCHLFKADPSNPGKWQQSVGNVYPPTQWIGFAGDLPPQTDCASVINTLGEKVIKQGQGDRYEEVYEVLVRSYGFLIGAFATTFVVVKGDTAGFLRDLTDVYDLYVMPVQNVALMKEGMPPFSDTLFEKISWGCLVFAYAAILLRFFGVRKILAKVSPRTAKIGTGVSEQFLSNAQDLVFLCLRVYAWVKYQVPVSVLMLKNIYGVFSGCFQCHDRYRQMRQMGSDTMCAESSSDGN